MRLRYDPYQVFRYSKTPAGLYARQKWLGEAETDQWKIAAGEAVQKVKNIIGRDLLNLGFTAIPAE